MDLIRTIDVASGGMSAQRTRLNVISMNLANANTTKTEEGTPYRRKATVFQTVPAGDAFDSHLRRAVGGRILGVKVSSIVEVPGAFKMVFDPAHPDADKNGYVYLPNVNLVEEMVQMLNANRAYEANAAVVKSAKDMALRAIEIGR